MERSPTRSLIAGLTAVALLGAACGSDDETSSTTTTATGTSDTDDDQGRSQAASGERTEVEIIDFVYTPTELEVAAGTSVSWTNQDFFGHTVTSGEPGDQTDRFDGVLGEVAGAEGMGFSFTFDEPGTYAYFCRFHPRMTATVTVTG